MQRRPDPNAPRRMTRRQYEALQRQRRQNRIAIAIIAGIAVLIIAAVVLILKPKPAPDAVTAMVDAVPTAAPVQQAAPAEDAGTDANTAPGGVDLAALTGTVPEGGGEEASDSGEALEAAEAAEPAAEATPVPELPQAVEQVFSTQRPDGSPRSVRLRFVGDIMFCDSQLKYAKAVGDFHPQFEMIADQLQNADYTLGNMEGTIGKYKKSSYSGYPMFNAPKVALQPLKDYGIDFLTLANNHMLDRWSGGVKNTVDWVEQYGFAHVGAYRTKAEKDKPVIYEVGGIKFGFVAYTHSTNTMENRGADPEGVAYAVPYIQKADFKADIQKLRAAGADVVIAFPHWGEEYVRTPDSSQKKYAKQLAEAGADIIIGSHSHMVQPMGYQIIDNDSGSLRQVFTMFSMGNFISDHTVKYTDCGVILDFTVNEHADGTFTCDNVGYIPTYTWQQDGAVKVLPSGRYLKNKPSGMNDSSYKRMVESYYDIVEMLGDEFQLISG